MSARRLPDWFRRDLAPGHEAQRTGALLKELGLHTICESGRCPNRNECYSQKTATFMILGEICTRHCGFCSVTTGRPAAPDPDEPRRVARAAKGLGLQYVVVTSVDRDDLEDEGASHFSAVIGELKKVIPGIIVEILTPDFKRTQSEAVEKILGAEPHVFGHNLETVPRLYKRVRPGADYKKSLGIFQEVRSRAGSVLTKSSLMLGLGETEEEVRHVLEDLREAGCDILTVGQYLKSDPRGIPVVAYVLPGVFEEVRCTAMRMGFGWVESAPLVRSSYHARESLEFLKNRRRFSRGFIHREREESCKKQIV